MGGYPVPTLVFLLEIRRSRTPLPLSVWREQGSTIGEARGLPTKNLSHLVLTVGLSNLQDSRWMSGLDHPHFTDEDTEVRRDKLPKDPWHSQTLNSGILLPRSLL